MNLGRRILLMKVQALRRGSIVILTDPDWQGYSENALDPKMSFGEI